MLDDQVVGCEEAVVVGGTAAAADVPVGTAAAVAKDLTNAAALYLTIPVCPMPLLLPSTIPRETARTTTLAAAPPPAALPKATDSERVGITLGGRGGTVRLHYLLYLAIGICIANKVVYSHSRVFS